MSERNIYISWLTKWRLKLIRSNSGNSSFYHVSNIFIFLVLASPLLSFSMEIPLGADCAFCTREIKQTSDFKLFCSSCNHGMCDKCLEFALFNYPLCSNEKKEAHCIKVSCSGCKKAVFVRLIDQQNVREIAAFLSATKSLELKFAKSHREQ